MNFCLDLLYAFGFNLIYLLCLLIAYLRAEASKRPWGWFIAGVVV